MLIVTKLLFRFFKWIWKDFKKIDLSYINQSKITYNYNNINSPALRKAYNFYNKAIGNFLVTNISYHKNYWKKEDSEERNKLPELKILKNNKNYTLNSVDNEKNYRC